MNELRMAENFIARYSKARFAWLLDQLAHGVSTSTIAGELEVTRQRVHQWKLAFTTKKISIKPKIMSLVQHG